MNKVNKTTGTKALKLRELHLARICFQNALETGNGIRSYLAKPKPYYQLDNNGKPKRY